VLTHLTAHIAMPLRLRVVSELLLGATLAERVIQCHEPRRQRGELFRLSVQTEGDDILVGGGGDRSFSMHDDFTMVRGAAD
jgi:hypothetical protein